MMAFQDIIVATLSLLSFGRDYTMAFNVLAVLFTLTHLARCIPAPNDLGSDLTILINNDILGKI